MHWNKGTNKQTNKTDKNKIIRESVQYETHYQNAHIFFVVILCTHTDTIIFCCYCNNCFKVGKRTLFVVTVTVIQCTQIHTLTYSSDFFSMFWTVWCMTTLWMYIHTQKKNIQHLLISILFWRIELVKPLKFPWFNTVFDSCRAVRVRLN